MDPLKYIEFKKDDIIINCVESIGFTDMQADEIIARIEIIINQLRAVRNSIEKNRSNC